MVNSVMVLNRQRFLAKYGLDDLANVNNSYNGGGGGGGDSTPLKAQIVGLLHAVGYLKVPVIVANIVTIIFEIFFGG